MVTEGMKTNCLPLHLFCSRRAVPSHVIEHLVMLNPSALLEPDERESRFPLHIATERGMSQEILDYLCNAQPQALRYADQDGNYPLHYAAMYSCSNTLRLFVEAFPDASRFPNERNRLPLHLMCTRFFEDEESCISSQDLKLLIKAYPEALRTSDRSGRMPLHLAAAHPHPKWEVLETLIQGNSSVLLCKDDSEKSPLLMAKKNRKHKGGHVIQSLAKCTLQEKRKEIPFFPAFMVSSTFSFASSRGGKGKEKVVIHVPQAA